MPSIASSQSSSLERLLEISRGFSESQNFQTILQTIVDAACQLSGCEASSILMIEPETNFLKFIAASGDQIEALTQLRIPLENSIAGECFQQERAILVNEATRDDRIFREVDKSLRFETCSLLALPVRFGGQAIGVIEVVNKSGGENFSVEDITVLETLAAQAAVAIRNHQFTNETQSRLNDLAELDKMKADFIAIASHELRTPLGLILGHATILREIIEEAGQRKQIDIIIQSALRLKKIIDDLSNIQRMQNEKIVLHREVYSADKLVRDILEQYVGLAKKNQISLASELPQQNLSLLVDKEKIDIALGNLIKNSLTFSRPGGHVLIAVENLPGYVKISIIDDGIGIPSKDLQRIFDRFYQVETHMTRKIGGMGLGLSVAKAMVELHGGQIWAESVEGQGSNFSILLPSAPSD
jgi:signal transduction histidine kinase